MFSKEESKQIRQEFWTSFGQRSLRKWILYNTKIKEVNLKFHFDNKKAQVGFVIDTSDEIIKPYYFEKFESLKTIMKEEISETLVFDEFYETESGKMVGFIYIELDNVSIHNKKTWEKVYVFFETFMPKFETFFAAYKDFLVG
ncbi:DUF4268 domain-containing protein [Mesonia sp. K7]|uniref:DUF4268 domain-containing protein n=1 Tax=Mesonia sp. K7 TaxID=2218606 RepID=UPI000DA83D47|nr:DUF4268 domain-containing protein [Mesonia sp. K7]PZD77026.1 DUF4268 domain-containing protein [Mesonia sp. K7]